MSRKKSSHQKVVTSSQARIKFRSKFEKTLADKMVAEGIPFTYEKIKLKWVDPAKNRVYTPDYYLPEQDLVIEAKGFWKPTDRLKMILVIEQHPERDIRMVFQDANKKINKGSGTTYADWCDKYGIKWAHKEIPESWIATGKTVGTGEEIQGDRGQDE